MACDEALLADLERGGSTPTLRFYGWASPAVSLGRHQPAPDPEALARLAALGLEWVRRPTGGRAVFHGPPAAELTYSIAARLDDPALGGSAAAAYQRIHEGLSAGLERLGVPAALAPRSPSSRRGRGIRPTSRLACFGASVPWEITAGGRKLVGSAQLRGRVAFLQHGSIPLAGHQRELEEVWPGSLDPGTVTNVSQAAGCPVSFQEAAAALTLGFAAALGIELMRPGERPMRWRG